MYTLRDLKTILILDEVHCTGCRNKNCHGRMAAVATVLLLTT